MLRENHSEASSKASEVHMRFDICTMLEEEREQWSYNNRSYKIISIRDFADAQTHMHKQ